MSWDILPKANLQYFLQKLKEKFDLKVDKVSGKGLSTNDYTTSEKNKLSGIAAGAEVNVQSDWNASSGDAFIKNKPTIPAAQVNSDWAATSGVSEILNKPMIPTVNNATLTIQKNGTTVKTFTANASSNVTCNITVPTKTSDITNDSNYVSDVSYVHTDNNYTTTEKNKLSGIANGAEVNVQSDWNVTNTSSDAFIKNKPTIPAAQVNSDWNSSSGVSEILNKPTIPTNLNSLSDVTISSLADKQIFYYDNSASLWKNTTTPTFRGNTTIDRQNGKAKTESTAATIGTSYLILGNSTAYNETSGGGGNSKGVIRFFGSGSNRIDLSTKDGEVVGNRTLYLPYTADKKTLATTDDIKTYTGTGLISVNSSTNEISTDAEINQNAYSSIFISSGGAVAQIFADAKQDVFGLTAGSEISLSVGDNDEITINSSDQKLKQTKTDSGNKNYRVLFTYGTPSATVDAAEARFSTRLYYNTSTKLLTTTDGTYYSGIAPNDVYIGNTSATTGARLHASGDQDLMIQASSEGAYGVKLGTYETTPAWAFAPMANNVLRLGSPSLKWTTIYATNSTINTSDRNEKENIVDLDSEFAKDFIMDLKPVSFKRIEGDRTHYGLIAQDVEDTLTKFNLTSMNFGGLCKDDVSDKTVYGLRYEEFISPLIKTVQKQQQEIEYLKAEINILKENNNVQVF